ncbi:MAG: dTDP-4-dehydrorhamnose reductase [Patescibacteria group bacterium]
MAKILIIGAKGMLGQELVSVFKSDKDYKVIAWDKDDLDIANEVAVHKKIKVINPKIIINSAAYNAVDKCEEKKEFEIAKKINGLALGYLAKIAKKIGAMFIHYSTDYVFDGKPKIEEPEGCAHSCHSCMLHANFQPEIGFKESDKPKPINKYGKTKLLGEIEVQKNTKKYYIIRTSKLFGKPAKAEGAKKSFFDVMLELGGKNKSVKIVNDEISCYTYAPDLARKTKEIVEAKKPFGIYHVTNSGACTWHQAALELYKLKKVKTKVIPIASKDLKRPAKRPEISVLINTKLNPLRSWKEALKEYLSSTNSE